MKRSHGYPLLLGVLIGYLLFAGFVITDPMKQGSESGQVAAPIEAGQQDTPADVAAAIDTRAQQLQQCQQYERGVENGYLHGDISCDCHPPGTSPVADRFEDPAPEQDSVLYVLECTADGETEYYGVRQLQEGDAGGE